jgi:hypothetical protein
MEPAPLPSTLRWRRHCATTIIASASYSAKSAATRSVPKRWKKNPNFAHASVTVQGRSCARRAMGKRISPPSCGGGALPDAEDVEEAQLRARVAAFDESPEGCARYRIRDLEMQDFRGGRSAAEQNELDSLRTLYPDLPLDPDNPLTEAFEAWRRVAAE